MFERFTDRARRAVVLAQEEARLLNHSYIGTEHVLLGLLHEEDGVVFEAFRTLDVDLVAARIEVEQIIGRGAEPPAGHIPFTPRAKKVLELSLRESLQLGHDYIGSEHILLGLLREAEGVACQVLMRMGLTLEAIRSKVYELTNNPDAPKEQPPRRMPFSRCKHPDDSLQISNGIGLRTVRCVLCGELVGILPESTREAG